jgi:hypothetical protein
MGNEWNTRGWKRMEWGENGIEHITPTLKGLKAYPFQVCQNAWGSRKESRKEGRERREGKKRNRERRNERKRGSFQERTVGEKEKGRRGWINDPEKEAIRGT